MVHRLVRSALVGLSISTALIIASSIQASAAVSPSAVSAGYWSSSFPPIDGQLVAWMNVVPVTCTAQAPNGAIESIVRAVGWRYNTAAPSVVGYIRYLCNDGTPSYQATIDSGIGRGGEPSSRISPDDAVRFVFNFETPLAPGQKVLTVRDMTSGVSASIKPPSLKIDAISLLTETGTNIPKFTSIHYYNVSLNGQPLSAVPGLSSENMLNTKGKVMVRTSGLTTNGEGFSTTFVRTG